MKLAVRKTSTVLAAVATAGASSIFLGAAPAYAADTEACGPTGDVVAPGVCEQSFTTETSVFTPTAQMTKLEVLLVGAGGNGANYEGTSSKGYAAGGGGEVKIVDFSGTTTPLTVTVPSDGITGGVDDGTTNVTVNNGADGSVDPETIIPTGGASGSGNLGAVGTPGGEVLAAGGGGAGGDASGANGGAGVVVDSIAASGSLFSGDTRCFGGGGAIAVGDFTGIPGCGGGVVYDEGEPSTPSTPNSGGGGATGTSSDSPGAEGFVAIRWTAADVTLSFDVNGHGTAPADQTVAAGANPTAPTAPTATGYEFDGWYTDAALTTPADFTAPLTSSATFYAKWSLVLAETGGTVAPAPLWIGFAALFAGAGLVLTGYRRRRRAD